MQQNENGWLGPPNQMPRFDLYPFTGYPPAEQVCEQIPVAATGNGSTVYRRVCRNRKQFPTLTPIPVPVTPNIPVPATSGGGSGATPGAGSGAAAGGSGFSLDALFSGEHSTLLIVGAAALAFFMFKKK